MKTNSINNEYIDNQFVEFSHILRSMIAIINIEPCSGRLNDNKRYLVHQT